MPPKLRFDGPYNLTNFSFKCRVLKGFYHLSFTEVSQIPTCSPSWTLGVELCKLCKLIPAGKIPYNLFCLCICLYPTMGCLYPYPTIAYRTATQYTMIAR